MSKHNSLISHACFCVGPQNGEPRCPCSMRSIIKRGGRYIQTEVDLGPASDQVVTSVIPEPTVCGGCGHRFYITAKFCPECGASL